MTLSLLATATFNAALALWQQTAQNPDYPPYNFRGRGFDPRPGFAIVPLAALAFVIILIWMRMRLRQREIQAHADMQKQLIDKFGSGKELGEFLATPGGQKFMQGMGPLRSYPRYHTMRGLRGGIILTLVGASILALHLSPGYRNHGGVVLGVILLAIGVGLLISTAVSSRMAAQSDSNHPQGPGSAYTS